MRRWKYCVLIFFLSSTRSHALSCRSEHSSKGNELKKVYNNCLKQIEGNSSDNRRHSEEWSERHEQRNQWQRDERNENENNEDRNRNRDHNRNEDDRNQWDRQNKYNEQGVNEYNRMNGNNRMDSRQEKTGNRNDKRGSVNGVDMNSRGRSDMNNYGRNDRLNGQDDFLESEEYDSDTSRRNYPSQYQSQASRSYKRERGMEQNSGQRSQYNPHSQQTNRRGDDYNNDRNSSDNSSQEVDKACALHCFLENLHMTGDTGMPDRYLVTHSLIKDEKNEDLRDFLQESIEECFQILDNENTEDKCEFSKNLLTCLSEKGRANCDDWTGKTRFLFE
uniref:Odorant binding protein 45 n=1 Tax=Heliconius charithonia TaxID=33434 RepID=A0AA49EZY3_HELCH|nr:odorant binding protein 45 [Heliconius charithonia]